MVCVPPRKVLTMLQPFSNVNLFKMSISYLFIRIHFDFRFTNQLDSDPEKKKKEKHGRYRDCPKCQESLQM